MALEQVHESDEEEFYSVKSPRYEEGPGDGPETQEQVREGEGEGGGQEEEEESVMEPPTHPVPALQAAFEESIVESNEDDSTSKMPEEGDAEARRQKLLDAHHFDDSWTTRWKQKPGAQHHPLLKLMAQIFFGMHLLQQQQAKSNEEVVKILQTHVNEVDSFLERTAEDFNLAIADIEERIRHLKLPMEHLDVFKVMLDDKQFRTQLLNGNDQIERIIDRTTKAMNAALTDVRHGAHATRELGKYLESVKDRWPRYQGDIADVYGAMRGNEQGWNKYLKDLKAKGSNLHSLLLKLSMTIGEMSKLAAEVSRKNRPTSQHVSPSRSAPSSPRLRSKFNPDSSPPRSSVVERKMSLNKPLPREPNTTGGAIQATESRPHPIPFAQRYEKPRHSPQAPLEQNKRISSAQNGLPPRPKTAGAPREARASRTTTSDLADFLKDSGPFGSQPPPMPTHSSPLRSHPPEPELTGRQKHSEIRVSRSRSEGANEILNAVSSAPAKDPRARSKSQQGPTAVVLTSRPSSRAADAFASHPGSRGGERAMSVKSMPTSRKDSVSTTGFARRLSKRMKHIPPIDDAETPNNPDPPRPQTSSSSRPQTASGTQAADSAYASSTEHHQPTPPQRSATVQVAPARPPSRFALFPRTPDPPPTPSIPSAPAPAAHNRNTQSFQNGRIPDHTPDPDKKLSPPSHASKSRSLRLRNFFHRKQKSQMA